YRPVTPGVAGSSPVRCAIQDKPAVRKDSGFSFSDSPQNISLAAFAFEDERRACRLAGFPVN
ncbi:MAG: hypothetical protein PSX71_09490, partial [bacterium]|nr:hypothetical protein [bacterium]